MARRTPRRDPTRPRPGSGPRATGPVTAPELAEMVIAATPEPANRRAVTGLLLRFVSCGLLALAGGIAWRLTLAPARVSPGTAFAGIFALLTGFIAGGVLWYLRDAQRRRADPESVSDERLVFSFVVFAVMPMAVLIFVGAIWVVVRLLGGI